MTLERLRLIAPRLMLAAVAVVAAWRAPDAVRAAHEDRRQTERLTVAQRELAGALGVDIDTGFLESARATIPPDAVYYVAVGGGVEVSTPVTLDAVTPFAAYWLLPRRRTDDPAAAGWIVSYGGDLEALGLRYARTIQVQPGLVLAEVAR